MRHSRSIGGILTLGVLLIVIFLLWIAVAHAIYIATFGHAPPESIPNFLRQVFTTPQGWTLIVVGNGVGFLFAVVVLMISVVSFPLLLDRNVGAGVAILTSARVVLRNPVTMAMWGLIIAGLLLIGSLPLFIGLAVVMPVLGHSSWHLYRKVVEPDPNPQKDEPIGAETTAPALRCTVSGFSLRWRGPAVESRAGAVLNGKKSPGSLIVRWDSPA